VVNSGYRTDVFIVGGGPAGLAAAIVARQRGLRVIVADGSEPPIEKTCGEGMMPETLTALRAMGVQLDSSQGRKFFGISFAQDGTRVSANFPQGPGLGLRRPVLHERMVETAQQCGVQFLWKTPVLGIDSDGVQLHGPRIRTRWIVGADGSGSRVRRWAGLDATHRCTRRFASRQHYRMQPWSNYLEICWGRHSQAYVTPVEREEVCVVILADRTKETSFGNALQEFPELRERLAGQELSSRDRGAVTLTHTLRSVQRDNVALIGDASGGVDAITGEGIRLAFQQASALADAMVIGDLRLYQCSHRALVSRPMRMGDLLLWLGRHPRIRSRVIRALGSRPDLFARLLAAHVGAADAADLFSAGALLGWRLLNV
jgi:menaquinone-9 beta-reductase